MLKRLLATSLAVIPLSLCVGVGAAGAQTAADTAIADKSGSHEAGSQSATLAEAWLAWQERRQAEGQPPLDWAYSFALRREDAPEVAFARARLVNELHGLGERLGVAGKTQQAEALAAWAEAIAASAGAPLRTPERLGLPRLAANLRHNPPMSEIAQLGTCTPPEWVETWTLAGVGRLAWHPGMTLDDALAALPDDAAAGVDHARLIDPVGERHRLGIAAWNHQGAPLAPGARVVVELPGDDGAEGAVVRLINARLAEWLAMRVPGEECEIQGVKGSRE
ncbi:capsule biosynthesis GfcC family protein [Halomonas sp. SSL-5]|uniref:capsule biosynthesis GfcC family protein n=1 Tax=Halomonas sp. SSL-5 TaxID=3065855 RepID=UPI00273A3DAC|nr:capsule biosynthesis GfcC family protein [Halomonas sp. SSL-5]MDY7116691.1 capsule biosynthesis GfcC family protein [Halomonas sp. SSL-5]